MFPFRPEAHRPAHRPAPLNSLALLSLGASLMLSGCLGKDEAKAAPPELLRRMVAAGDLGRKSGRGFYPYA